MRRTMYSILILEYPSKFEKARPVRRMRGHSLMRQHAQDTNTLSTNRSTIDLSRDALCHGELSIVMTAMSLTWDPKALLERLPASWWTCPVKNRLLKSTTDSQQQTRGFLRTLRETLPGLQVLDSLCFQCGR